MCKVVSKSKIRLCLSFEEAQALACMLRDAKPATSYVQDTCFEIYSQLLTEIRYYDGTFTADENQEFSRVQ